MAGLVRISRQRAAALAGVAAPAPASRGRATSDLSPWLPPGRRIGLVPFLARVLGALIVLVLAGATLAGAQAQFPAQTDARLRVGDILALALPGEPALTTDLAVDRNGHVTLPEVGPVEVAGRTLGEADAAIRTALARAYRHLTPLTVSLKERRLPLTVLGHVGKPGEVNLPGYAGVQEALAAAGGTLPGARLDKLQLRRGKEVTAFDLKSYLDTGEPGKLPELAPLDVIFVPTIAEPGEARDGTAVKVFGEVGRPGAFAFKDGLGVVDMMVRAGGVTPFAALDQIRVIDGGEPVLFNLKRYLDSGDAKLIPPLRPGAVIFVPRQQEEIRRAVRTVYVIGAVNRPGVLEAPPDARLLDILALAGGPAPQADMARLRILKADGSVVPFDLSAVLDGNRMPLPEILPGDALYVPGKAQAAQPPAGRTMEVTGAVQRPGRQDWSPGMSLMDLLGMAGGPTARGDMARIEITRAHDGKATTFDLAAFLAKGGNVNDLPRIEPGDVIRVPDLPDGAPAPRATQTADEVVHILGQVVAPGRHAFARDTTFLDALSAAGGPTGSADLRNVRVSHRSQPGSKVTVVNLARYFATGDERLLPKLRPGDVIFLPDRANRDGFDTSSDKAVRVLGAVNRPGRFRLGPGMTLLDLLAEAGGPNRDAYPQKIVVVNLSCCRDQARVFDLVEFARTGDASLLPVVQAGDTVYVPFRHQSEWKIFALILAFGG